MAFSVVQSSGELNTGTTTCVYTWTTNPTISTSRKVLVFVTAYGPPASISVSDNAATPNTYTQRINVAGDSRVCLFEADITSLPSSGQLTTTITISAASDTTANMIEIDGLVTSGAYDSAGTVSQSGGAPHTLTPGTLAQASNVQFGIIGGNGGPSITLTQPTGFTPIVIEPTNAYIEHGSAYRVINTTTPGSSQWTASATLAGDGLVAYKLSAASAAAALAAAAASVSSVVAQLTTGKPLNSAPTVGASATGALTTQKRLAAASAASALASAALSTSIRLVATTTSASTATGAISTQLRVAAAAVSVGAVTAALTTVPQGLSSNAASQAAVTASLTASVRLVVAAAVAAQATANLLTSIQLSASAQSIAGGAASLNIGAGVPIAASAVALVISSAALTTKVLLRAAAVGRGDAAAVLDTGSLPVLGSPSGRQALQASRRGNSASATRQNVQTSLR